MKIEQNVSLASLTTFKIGGPAHFFVEVASVGDLRAAMGYALARDLPVFILGGGSNILVSDKGFRGLVVRIALKGIECDVIAPRGECVAYPGESWDDVVRTTVEKGLWGLENLSLIPGTVGGAVVQNIGAYGTELKDTFLWADALDMRTGNIKRLRSADCNFEYRSSFFKTSEGGNYVVIKTAFTLSTKPSPAIFYKDLGIYFSERNISNPSLVEIRDAVIAIRTAKLPNMSEYGTAGSFFKNPLVDKGHFDHLSMTYPGLSSFPTERRDFMKVSAAWIIDKVCNLKGYRDGDAGVFDKQALVLVNHGKASAADIDALAKKIVKAVFEATGIKLEREVESV